MGDVEETLKSSSSNSSECQTLLKCTQKQILSLSDNDIELRKCWELEEKKMEKLTRRNRFLEEEVLLLNVMNNKLKLNMEIMTKKKNYHKDELIEANKIKVTTIINLQAQSSEISPPIRNVNSTVE